MTAVTPLRQRSDPRSNTAAKRCRCCNLAQSEQKVPRRALLSVRSMHHSARRLGAVLPCYSRVVAFNRLHNADVFVYFACPTHVARVVTILSLVPKSVFTMKARKEPLLVDSDRNEPSTRALRGSFCLVAPHGTAYNRRPHPKTAKNDSLKRNFLFSKPHPKAQKP